MDLRQIELFLLVAEELNFTRAAKKANIVQSGISAAIQALESDLGAALFFRSTRQVSLTPAGKALLPEAHRILETVGKARKAVLEAAAGTSSGRLAFGAVQSLSALMDLPRLLQEFGNEHASVEITMREALPDDLLELLRQGVIDVALMPYFGVSAGNLRMIHLFSSPMVIVAGRQQEFDHAKAVSLNELEDAVFVDFSPRWSTRRLVDRIFSSQAVVRTIGFEMENIDVLFDFVRHGFGLALVPKALANNQDLAQFEVVSRVPGEPLPEWQFGMCMVKGADNTTTGIAAYMFYQIFQTHMREASTLYSNTS